MFAWERQQERSCASRRTGRSFSTAPVRLTSAGSCPASSASSPVADNGCSRSGPVRRLSAASSSRSRRTPTRAQLEWSDWLPHARPGAPPLPDQFTYRFKVARQSEPIREDVVGPFTIGTIATYFYKTSATDQHSVRSTFRVRYRDQPLPALERTGGAFVIGGASPSLLLEAEQPDGTGACFFVSDKDGASEHPSGWAVLRAPHDSPPDIRREGVPRGERSRRRPWLAGPLHAGVAGVVSARRDNPRHSLDDGDAFRISK